MGKTMGFLGSATSAGNIVGYMMLGFHHRLFWNKKRIFCDISDVFGGTLLFFAMWTATRPGKIAPGQLNINGFVNDRSM